MTKMKYTWMDWLDGAVYGLAAYLLADKVFDLRKRKLEEKIKRDNLMEAKLAMRLKFLDLKLKLSGLAYSAQGPTADAAVAYQESYRLVNEAQDKIMQELGTID